MTWDGKRVRALRAALQVTQQELAQPREFPGITAPTLGLWSSGDDYLLEEPVRRSGEHVTGGWRYERIDDASHWLQLDRPDRVNELLLEFLR